MERAPSDMELEAQRIAYEVEQIETAQSEQQAEQLKAFYKARANERTTGETSNGIHSN